jgi:glutamate-ammonia-ligase adenylyltransferase
MPHPSPDDVVGALPHVTACSEFVAAALNRDPELMKFLTEEGYLEHPRTAGSFAAALQTAVGSVNDETTMMALLRQRRRGELVRIAWRDLAGASSVEESLRDLTALADAAIQCAAEYSYRQLAERYGQPRGEQGELQPLVTLGMGKLGGGELNFSSDIDLVFLYPEAGDTDGRRPISNEEFFTRLARGLIRLLDAVTEDGFAFRVDMRLRPFGDSGPLAVSFAFFENYLQQQGRDWERYAYIKARAITGTEAFGAIYKDVLRPFVYRRYLDFGVFESLREMKAMIAREVERRELQDNVKLGPGGIREIEFIVQAFQLLRGGSDKRLQSQSLLSVLPLLAGEKLLPPATVEALRTAYLYLRRLENRLQMLKDEQTHDLPSVPDAQQRMVLAMGKQDWQTVVADLEQQRAAVTQCFQSVLFGPVQDAAPVIDLEILWNPQRQLPAIEQAIAAHGFADAGELASVLAQWRDSQFVERLDEAGRRRLQALIPKILEALTAGVHPVGGAVRNPLSTPAGKGQGEGSVAAVQTLKRVLSVLESLGRRSAYLALLNENPEALARLVEICARSDFLTRQIASFPLLLDELIDRRVFETLPTRAQFEQELAAKSSHAPDADPERQVEALRAFQRAAVFRVALADLTERLPLMHVSDRLTDIAELIVGEALRLAWDQMTQQYGEPMHGDGVTMKPARVAIIAYGKLGAIELGYSSDLDLVFVHDSSGEVQYTSGAKSVENAVFFLRLGQRIVHLLTMHSAAGRLYEVDMRLRPSGKGGMMVTPLHAFAEYQRTDAWTWEHQALLRARAVAGDAQVRARFEDIRLNTLSNHVRRDSLREEVAKMRERMRTELSKSTKGQFDVKQDPGGLADIEFLAQYWALKWADCYPPLVTFPDTIRQLESVASADLVPQSTIDVLTATYREYRTEIHHRSLEGKPALVNRNERFEALREQVRVIWDSTMK